MSKISHQSPFKCPVAVAMAVYKRDNPELFARAINSILAQDYNDEIKIYLCVDGPLAEEAEEVIAKNAGNLFKIIRNERNIGLAQSLNRILKELEDEKFVFRMDSDDFSHPERIRLQVGEMKKNPDLDILGGMIREVDENLNVIRTVQYPCEHNKIRQLIAKRNPLAHPAVCFRKEAVERFKAYPETSINQDWALWFRCLAEDMRFSNMNRVLVDMTVSDAFFLRRGSGRAIEEFKILYQGILSLYGFNWRLVYPFLRFAFRLLPSRLVKLAYRSPLR